MQEASSIAKAVEQAWINAGKPVEFTIKVLEEPQKSFLGFTTRSAKIALFFDIHPYQKPKQRPKQQAAPETPLSSKRAANIPLEKPIQAPKREHKPQWNSAMVSYVKEWLSEVLELMGLDHISFTIEPSDFYLRIAFCNPVLPETSQEKKLFSSFATLIIESLKHTFKVSLKGHKIVLLHASHANLQS
jgi:predicted RNA-binding protein Jag